MDFPLRGKPKAPVNRNKTINKLSNLSLIPTMVGINNKKHPIYPQIWE